MSMETSRIPLHKIRIKPRWLDGSRGVYWGDGGAPGDNSATGSVVPHLPYTARSLACVKSGAVHIHSMPSTGNCMPTCMHAYKLISQHTRYSAVSWPMSVEAIVKPVTTSSFTGQASSANHLQNSSKRIYHRVRPGVKAKLVSAGQVAAVASSYRTGQTCVVHRRQQTYGYKVSDRHEIHIRLLPSGDEGTRCTSDCCPRVRKGVGGAGVTWPPPLVSISLNFSAASVASKARPTNFKPAVNSLTSMRRSSPLQTPASLQGEWQQWRDAPDSV